MESNHTSLGQINFSSVPSYLAEQGQYYPLRRLNNEYATPWTINIQHFTLKTNQFLMFLPLSGRH